MAANTCIVCGMHPAKSKRTRLCGSPVCSRIKRMEIDSIYDAERRKRALDEMGARRLNLRLSSVHDRRRAKTLYVAFRRNGRDPQESRKSVARFMEIPVGDALFLLRADSAGKKPANKVHPEVLAEYEVKG